MQYTDKKASELQAKHNIPDATIKVWKFRNRIPKRYENPNYTQSKKSNDKAVISKLKEILKRKEIAVSNFRSMSESRSLGFTRNKITPTKKEVLGLKTEITEVRNLLRAAIKSKSADGLQTIVDEKRLKHYIVFGRLQCSRLYYRNETLDIDKAVLELGALYNLIRI